MAVTSNECSSEADLAGASHPSSVAERSVQATPALPGIGVAYEIDDAQPVFQRKPLPRAEMIVFLRRPGRTRICAEPGR